MNNNFINNSVHAITSGNKEVWNDNSSTAGNYWSDYLNKYPNATEIGSSGIENSTYTIVPYNQDSYPLASPVLASENPIAEFPSWLLLPITMIIILIPAIIRK